MAQVYDQMCEVMNSDNPREHMITLKTDGNRWTAGTYRGRISKSA